MLVRRELQHCVSNPAKDYGRLGAQITHKSIEREATTSQNYSVDRCADCCRSADHILTDSTAGPSDLSLPSFPGISIRTRQPPVQHRTQRSRTVLEVHLSKRKCVFEKVKQPSMIKITPDLPSFTLLGLILLRCSSSKHCPKAMVSMKIANGRPAKIIPLKPPKEIHNNPIPPCAMETRPLDRLKA
jgi:hypothetical protein